MTDVPQIFYWRGKRIDTMSREELIQALIDQHELTQVFIDGAKAEREMFGRIMKSARPR